MAFELAALHAKSHLAIRALRVALNCAGPLVAADGAATAGALAPECSVILLASMRPAAGAGGPLPPADHLSQQPPPRLDAWRVVREPALAPVCGATEEGMQHPDDELARPFCRLSLLTFWAPARQADLRSPPIGSRAAQACVAGACEQLPHQQFSTPPISHASTSRGNGCAAHAARSASTGAVGCHAGSVDCTNVCHLQNAVFVAFLLCSRSQGTRKKSRISLISS